MFGLFVPHVNIGLNPDMAKDRRHGVAWVRTEHGGVTQQSFIVDHPQRLLRPNTFMISNMFHQLAKMGFYPVHLEIMLNGVRRVYKAGRIRPLLIQSM